MTLNKEHQRDICEESGIKLELALKCGFESYEEKIIDDGYDPKGRKQKRYISGGWQVPITNPLTGDLYYYRRKPDKPRVENKGKRNEREIKYETPAKQPPHLYFPKCLKWKEILEGKQEILITEGEKKCLALIQAGHNAVAVSGVWCWQKDKTPIEDLDLLLKNKRRVLICFDNDYHSNPKVRQALDALYSYILSKGSSPVFACTPEGIHKGVDDYIVAKGVDSFNSYLNLVRAKHAEKSQADYEIEEEALKMLKSPDYLDIVISDCRKLGLVGEERNIKLLYLAMASHKLDQCFGVIVKGDSSSGKTFLVKTIGSLMPDDTFEPITGCSTQALSYWTDISHKIIFVGESRPPNDEFWESDAIWRQLIEDNEITRKVTVKNPQTNKWEVETVTVHGPIVYISTTTQNKLHDENENRLLIVNTDHNINHIRDVLTAQRSEEGLDVANRMALEEDKAFIRLKHKKALELLPRMSVLNITIPFVEQIEFNTYGSSAMRDQKKLFKVLKMLAYLKQLSTNLALPWYEGKNELKGELEASNSQKPQLGTLAPGKEGGKNVCVSLEDYEEAYSLLKEVFDNETNEISEQVYQRWLILNEKFPDESFTVAQAKKILGIKEKATRNAIKAMLAANMIKEDDNIGKQKSYKCQYFMRKEAEIISPEALRAKLKTADKLHYTKKDTHTDLPTPILGTKVPSKLKQPNSKELSSKTANDPKDIQDTMVVPRSGEGSTKQEDELTEEERSLLDSLMEDD